MVGFDRDAAPDAPAPAAAPEDPDPCSFYKTKLQQFTDEKGRWYREWKDVLTERERAREKVERLESEPGSEGLAEAQRELDILNDRLRRYDSEVPKIERDIAEMWRLLEECKARRDGTAPPT